MTFIYSTHINLILNRYQFTTLINLNSLNKLLYSNNGKNLYIHNQIDSDISRFSHLCLDEIYLINHHSKIGIITRYAIKNIIVVTIISIK